MSENKNKPELATSNTGLKIKNIRKSLSKKPIVRDVSINVERGKAIGLLGQNGAGKTTTFYMTMGLINPDGGEIYLDESNITSLPMYKRARLGLGYLPQQPSIFRGLSVEDNIFSILETQKNSSDQIKNILEELLTEFSLTHLRRAMPYNLSGGERRRTEIARCLASNPKIILMDEPFAGVDPIGINDIKELIKHLTDRNIGILVTDHQSREVLDTCEYSYIMHAGEIISEGELDPHDILRYRGITQLAEHIVKEVQDVYRLQGVAINDKHIEVILRQMLKKVEIETIGDTDLIVGEQMEKNAILEIIDDLKLSNPCLLYTSPSPRDRG